MAKAAYVYSRLGREHCSKRDREQKESRRLGKVHKEAEADPVGGTGLGRENKATDQARERDQHGSQGGYEANLKHTSQKRLAGPHCLDL